MRFKAATKRAEPRNESKDYESWCRNFPMTTGVNSGWQVRWIAGTLLARTAGVRRHPPSPPCL